MVSWFLRILSEFKNRSHFNDLEPRWRDLVFYAESGSDWPHYERIILNLLERGQTITYLTSAWDDPVLTLRNLPEPLRKNFLAFCIGDGTVRTLLFKELNCRVCVLSLPDLEKYQLKRSIHPVHYVYIFHSINSVHRVYREHAFDAYDTVFCVGPHHVAEIRATEQVYRLKPKTLIEQGHNRIDALLERQSSVRAQYQSHQYPNKKIVLGPSWGECSFIEGPLGKKLVTNLLEGGHEVTLRLHPMTLRHFPQLVRDFEQTFGQAMLNHRFRVVTDMGEQDSLAQADLMVSDWSGAALDFAFGLERPVLYLDTTPKINNPAWKNIGIEPLEASIRSELGLVLPLQEVDGRLNEAIHRLCEQREQRVEAIRASRQKWVYHLGRSGAAGADALSDILNRTS